MSSEKRTMLDWPWERDRNPGSSFPDYFAIDVKYDSTNFETRCYENRHLDWDTKVAALKASASVVSLITYSDNEEIFQGTGTIIDEDGTIFTSTKLVRCPIRENVVAECLKVIVHLHDGKSFDAKLSAYDFYYGIAVVKIQDDIPQLKAANLRLVDDSFSLDEDKFRLRHHSDKYKLVPGDKVIVLGRYFLNPYWLMAAPGEFSMNLACDCFKCGELFRATCLITETGTGGPLVNCHGEVIGIASYDPTCTPFLPINIALKWWEHHTKYENQPCEPLLGLKVANLYTSDLQVMEKVIYKFPYNFAGVVVEEVEQGSSADIAGIRPNDLIVEGCGRTVLSFLEWLDIIWNNNADSIEVVVMRAREDAPLKLTIKDFSESRKRKRVEED